KGWRKGGQTVSPPKDGHFAPDLERSRFAEAPLLAYRAEGGEALFALQVRPALPDAPPLPTDYLVVIETSASKAMGPLAIATLIAQELARQLGGDDRMAVWTANVKPRDVSRGFKAAKALDDAFKELAKEVPLGAVSLKRCLTEAVASFEVKASRRRVVVYLGDGKSVAEPLDAAGRSELCDSM